MSAKSFYISPSVLLYIVLSFGCLNSMNGKDSTAKTEAAYMAVVEKFLRADSTQDYKTMYGLLHSSIRAEISSASELSTKTTSSVSNLTVTHSSQLRSYNNVSTTKIVTIKGVTGAENTVVNYCLILCYEQDSWHILFCNPSHLDQVFAENFERILSQPAKKRGAGQE